MIRGNHIPDGERIKMVVLVIPPCNFLVRSVVVGLIRATVYRLSRRYLSKAK